MLLPTIIMDTPRLYTV